MGRKAWAITGIFVAIFAIALMEDQKGQERSEEIERMKASMDDSASKAWNYRTTRDEMRGTTFYTAEIEAQGFPADAPRLIIQRTDKGYDIAIRASLKSGASEFPRCIPGRRWHVNVKFDDGNVRQVACSQEMDVLLPVSLLPSLKASKQMMIEMQAGGYPVQYKFRTSGLNI